MTTSRTGTSRWLKVRAKLIRTRPHTCHWCRRRLNATASRGAEGAIEIDHLEPVALRPDLEFDEDNLVLACRRCNRSKGHGTAPGVPTVYDIHGIRIIDPTVTCRFHSPIKASCPHCGSLR